MNLPMISVDEYPRIANERIKHHPAYKFSMEFRKYPCGTNGSAINGIELFGQNPGPIAFADVHNGLAREFDLQTP